MLTRIGELEYLSFSSSGSRGFLFEGVLQALESNLPDFHAWTRRLRGISGTSGGAIMALIVALSIDKSKRAEIVLHLSDLTNVISCPNISHMLNNFGIEDGFSFKKIIQSILSAGGLSEHSTLGDLSRLLRIDIVFVAHNLLNGETVNLSADNAPDLLVHDAVFASCCLPFVFAPLKYKNLVLCDGCLSSYAPNNFPLANTLHVLIPPPLSCENINNWQNFIRSFLVGYIVYQRPSLDLIRASRSCILVDHPIVDNMRSLETNMDRKTLHKIVHGGFVVGVLHLYEGLTEALALLTRRYVDIRRAADQLGLNVSPNDAPDFEYDSSNDRCDE